MNGEWIFQVVLVLTSALVSALVGYLLGKRSQKLQIIREYVTDIVKNEYPALYEEMTMNSETLDNYLEKPNVNFNFFKLSQFYDRGLDEFMKRHHKDLFLMVDSFHKNILPKFYELSVRKLMDKLFDVSYNFLRKSLPREVVNTAAMIAVDLAKTINPYYIVPDLLNERYEEARNKIEECILDRTSHIYREKAESQFAYVIKRQSETINFDEISQSLIEKAKPEITNFLEAYKELKKQNDKEVKEKILPLLQKYISNPI